MNRASAHKSMNDRRRKCRLRFRWRRRGKRTQRRHCNSTRRGAAPPPLRRRPPSRQLARVWAQSNLAQTFPHSVSHSLLCRSLVDWLGARVARVARSLASSQAITGRSQRMLSRHSDWLARHSRAQSAKQIEPPPPPLRRHSARAERCHFECRLNRVDVIDSELSAFAVTCALAARSRRRRDFGCAT